MNPVDAALAKKKKVTLSANTVECKYCGKVYHTGKKLMDHINQEHSGEQTIFACPFCTQPFNQYSEYLQHLGEHKDRVIRCRLCNKEFKTITRLRVHTKMHVNQCPFSSVNFLTPQALQVHVTENHEADPGAVERQCSLCEFTSDSISKLAEHNQSVHPPTVVTSASYIFLQNTSWKTTDWLSMKSVLWELQWMWAIRATSRQNCQNLETLELHSRGHPGRRATRATSCQSRQHH